MKVGYVLVVGPCRSYIVGRYGVLQPRIESAPDSREFPDFNAKKDVRSNKSKIS